MYPSGINGTQKVTKVVKESFEEKEAFKVNLHLQKVNVIEVDADKKETTISSDAQLERDPEV